MRAMQRSKTARRRAMKTHVETTESNRNDGSGDHFLRSGNRDSHGVDPTTELMTSSTACLGARKVPADNPMVHGVGEPCKVHQDRIYIQVKVKTATMATKSHLFAQWKMPSKGTDVLPGSKGTESETDVELPGVFGDEQTPQNS